MHVGSDRSVRQVLAAPRVKLQMQEGEGARCDAFPFSVCGLSVNENNDLFNKQGRRPPLQRLAVSCDNSLSGAN